MKVGFVHGGVRLLRREMSSSGVEHSGDSDEDQAVCTLSCCTETREGLLGVLKIALSTRKPRLLSNARYQTSPLK